VAVAREVFQKYHRGSGGFFFDGIVNLYGLAQDWSFCECNTQKRGESDESKLIELI
jgi:hypothetical protein